ncbi:MAG: formylglycine-generating enzyme family protein [Candidatus Methylomirabilales bacterium]
MQHRLGKAMQGRRGDLGKRRMHAKALRSLGLVLLVGSVVAGATPAAPQARANQIAQPEMILIPAGWFMLGTDTWDNDEAPAQRVYLPAYFIGRTEVTNREYQRYDPTHTFPPGEEDHPVTNVTWAEAKAYARWAGKRLPTEWEWEKAARGTDGRRYPWGEERQPSWANTRAAGFGDTVPVASFPRDTSPFGLLDTVGNVAEWTASWYTPYPGGPTTNADFGETFRVIRGTSWDGDFDCDGRTAFRNFAPPDSRHPTIGFRLAQDAE